jgi:hypothetical protein
MSQYNTPSESDFQNSAKLLLNLIKSKLACGAESDALETIRGVLSEAHRSGMKKALKSEGLL